MVTGQQIRLGRLALRWTIAQLSETTTVSIRTIKRVEASDEYPNVNARTMADIQKSLESAGIEFIGGPDDAPGIRIHKAESTK